MINPKNPFYDEEKKIHKLQIYLFKKRKIRLYLLNTFRYYHYPIIYFLKKIKQHFNNKDIK